MYMYYTSTYYTYVCFHWEQNQLAKVANVFGNSYRRAAQASTSARIWYVGDQLKTLDAVYYSISIYFEVRIPGGKLQELS